MNRCEFAAVQGGVMIVKQGMCAADSFFPEEIEKVAGQGKNGRLVRKLPKTRLTVVVKSMEPYKNLLRQRKIFR